MSIDERTGPLPKEPLRGARVTLRPNEAAFADSLTASALESLATVGVWMTWCTQGFRREEAESWYSTCATHWNEGSAYEFSIFDASGDFVGACGLNQFNIPNHFANLGYWIRESRQREGFAREAVGVLARFGFDVLHLGRIEIVAAESNYPSRRVAERVGAQFEGVLRNRVHVHGVAHPAAMYSLVPDTSSFS